MKNIKILTFHNAENYGAMLQAYALKTAISQLGEKPNFVNYINEDILKDYKLIRINSVKSFLSSILYIKRNRIRKINFTKFENKYLDGNSKRYYSKSEIEQDITPEDVYIAGSDQVWNPELTNGLSDIYTLNFGNNITKFSYGASIGNENLALEKYSKDFKYKLASLNVISVRENGAAKVLNEITNKNIEVVLDPTLLLNKENWDKLIEENDVVNLKEQKYILVYTLFESERVTELANELSKKTGYKIIDFRKYNAYQNELLSLYSQGPADFVNAIKNAEYVITNSFHGTVFSIIYNKQFTAVLPSERAGRIKDLLRLVNLEQRIDNGENELYGKIIDYTPVEKILNQERIKSIEFLKRGIGNI